MAITKTIELVLTPDELAHAFANMDNGAQAEFLSIVATIASKWGGGGWCQQAHEIATAHELSDGGRDVVRKLADHMGLIPDQAA